MGDCEDIAFVLASLLTASGISSYNVRVALGRIHTKTNGEKQSFDHVWVMYKNEEGKWTLIEPHTLVGRGSTIGKTPARGSKNAKNHSTEFEYEPIFVFNQDHLWSVKNPNRQDDPKTEFRFNKKKWQKLNPKFHGDIHRSIIEEALAGLDHDKELAFLRSKFSKAFFVFGPIIDDVDNTLKHKYHPFEHFDNGYIPESWSLVEEHLKNFTEDNTKLDDFAFAAHAISDFYAHTSFAHFMIKDAEGNDQIYDQNLFDNHRELLLRELDYEKDAEFNAAWQHGFSVNESIYKGSQEAGQAIWRDKLISGRYAQRKDTRAGLVNQLIEGTTFIPKNLEDADDYNTRGALPHHNEIAVDESDFGAAQKEGHKLYKTKEEFQDQFDLRKSLAVKHVRSAFLKAVSK